MEDQGKFLEMLQEVTEIAKAQQNKITKAEVKKYLGETGLSEEQMQAVYHYLGENHIAVEGYLFVPDKKQEQIGWPEKLGQPEKMKSKAQGKAKKETRREANLRQYQDELAMLSGDLENEEQMILAFLHGDVLLKDKLAEKYLKKVVELAKKYEPRGVQMDEVIAEGNVGLMLAMQVIEENCMEYILQDGSLDRHKFFGTLELEVVHAMESYIDSMAASKGWEDALLTKVNLLHEAVKYLAEEFGREPAIDELADYTKLPGKEIRELYANYLSKPKQY